MKLTDIKPVPGDRAIIVKDNGLWLCELLCYRAGKWAIYHLNGTWNMSAECIPLEGDLVMFNGKPIKEEKKKPRRNGTTGKRAVHVSE